MHKLIRTNHIKLETVPLAVSMITSFTFASNTSTTGTIKIPRRIQRGPTDILQTLASTVSRDPTAAHYKYHDDPFLIPLSNVGKRTFAMAQEAGRKAAKWIVNENSQLFNHKVAEPPIEIFTPRVVYNENSQVEEDTLLKVISQGYVGDAIVIYDLLASKGIDVSEEAKQSLLELVCFSNEEEGLSEELIEERWFSRNNRTRSSETIIKTWKDKGVADRIFKSMIEPTPSAYSAIIQGMSKYGQVEWAWQHYETAREKGMALDVGTYNSLLSVVNVLKQGYELRWQLLQELLARMVEEKIQPNLDTLNAVLHSVSSMGGENSVQHALSCLVEFRELGIEPSLGSYYLLFQTMGRSKGSTINQGKVLSDILHRLEGKNLEIRHSLDTRFFCKAMEVSRYAAQDPILARRLDDLLHYGDNYNLIGDSFEESVYYRHFFLLLCATESVDKVMELYNILVPNIYTPETSVVQELIKAADASGDINLLPQFWSDMVLFDHADREPLLNQLLDALVRNEPIQGSPLVTTFADIAYEIWKKVEKQPANRVNIISWSGEMLSNILILATRSRNLEMASMVMKKITKEESYLGEPHIEALCAFVDLCIAENDFEKALNCLTYCRQTGKPEVATMAKDLRSRLELKDDQAQRLSELLADK